MTSKLQSAFRHLFGSMLRKIFLLLIIAVLMAAVYVRRFGLPAFVTDKIIGSMNTELYHVEASRILISLPRSLLLDDVKVFRTAVLGPPAVSMKRVSIVIDPLSLITEGPLLREISLRDGEIRPAMFFPSCEPGVTSPATQGQPQAGEFSFKSENCRILGMNVKSLACSVNYSPQRVTVSNIGVTITNDNASGDFSAMAEYDRQTQAISAKLTTRLDPHLLLPLIRAWEAPFTERLVGQFDFPSSPPTCEVEFSRSYSTGSCFNLSARLWMRDFRYLNVDVLRADGSVSLSTTSTNWHVKVSPVSIFRPEGSAIGSFSVNPSRSLVEFEGVSTIDPAALLHMAWVFTNQEMNVCQFDGPTRIKANGTVDYRDMTDTDFSLSFDGSKVALKSLPIEDCSFKMRMVGRSNAISDISASIYDGTLSGSGAFVLPCDTGSNIWYSISAELKGADFARVTHTARLEDEAFRGRLSVKTSLSGLAGAGNAKTIVGIGSVSIKNGRIFMLPVFGGLSQIMTKVIPGLEFVLRQTDGDADFTIADSMIHSDKIRVEGDVLSLTGRGNYMLDSSLDFDLRLVLMKEKTFLGKILRFFFYPISKLFEFKLKGTYEEPRWYPVNLSKDLLQKLHLTSKGVE